MITKPVLLAGIAYVAVNSAVVAIAAVLDADPGIAVAMMIVAALPTGWLVTRAALHR